MNSQQYTGLQAAMPQGSGARVQVQGGEGTTFDVNSAVKGIQQLGGVVSNHIQKTQDANRQIDYTLMQSQNAIKDKEAQQVLATLDPETRKVTLPDGTQQDHKAYVDTYSQAKNQTVNDFRGKYNYGHYSNDKIDMATRSVLETSSVENAFIKQQNELQIAEGRTVNATKKLISSMDIPADQALTATENALKATRMPYAQQRQVLSESAKTRVTLELSNQSLQTSKDLGELVKKYGDNKDTYDKKVQEYYSSEAYQHRVNSLLALQTYLENNPDLAGTAAETKLKIQQQEVNTLNEANVAVQGDKAALHASLLTQSLQDSQATSALALINPDSPALGANAARLKGFLNSPTTTQEDKAKVQREMLDTAEYQKVGRDITKVGNVLNYTYKGKNATVALKVEEMKISAQKEMERLAEKAANDAEKQQDKLARLFAPTPTMTNKTRAELEAQGVPVEVWEQMSGGTRWTDTELYQQVTINGLTPTAKQYAYGTPQFETVMKVYDSIHNFTKNESMAIAQLATNTNEAIGMREAYALQSELLKNNKGYNDLKYGIVQQVSADSSGLAAMGLNLSTLVDLSTALVMEEKHLDGLSFGYDKNKGTTNLKQLGLDVTAKVKELGSTYKNKTLLSLDAKNYVAKNLGQYYMLPPAIKGVIIPQDYLYSDKAKQNAPVIATINSIGKTISGYGLPPLTISSPTRTKPRLDKNGKAIATMHDQANISNGVVAIDISAKSDPAKAVDALLGGIGGMQAVGSNVEVRGGGRDFDNAYWLWSYVKQHGDLPAQSAGRGYEHLTKVQRADLVIKLKSIKRFENEGPEAENHLHFNCRVNPNNIWDNLPDETRKQAQNFSRRGGR